MTTTPSKEQGTGDQATGKERRVPLMAELLVCLAALTVLAVGLGVFPPAFDRRMQAAASSITPDPTHEAAGKAGVVLPNGSSVALPLSPHFPRSRAIGLILELEEMRRECESAVCHILAMDHLSGPAEEPAAELGKIAGLWCVARSRVASFLALENDRAALVLAALGWPWLGDDPAGLTVSDLPPSFSGRPAELKALSGEQWRILIAEADRNEPWPQTRAGLAARFGLGGGELRAIQAHLCRRHVARAFHSRRANRKARRTLARLADLAPAQVRAVMAMAGARELLEAGTFAFPLLIEMLESRPDLALPLLHQCVRNAGILEQALRAAADLGGANSVHAEEMLMALGPFGLDAIKTVVAERGGRAGAEAERLRRALETRWPADGNALEILGEDPALWRRWYRDAHSVL